MTGDLYICAGVSYRYFEWKHVYESQCGGAGLGRAHCVFRCCCKLLPRGELWATKTRSFWPVMEVTEAASTRSISDRTRSMWSPEVLMPLSCCGAYIVGLTSDIPLYDLTASSDIRSSFFHTCTCFCRKHLVLLCRNQQQLESFFMIINLNMCTYSLRTESLKQWQPKTIRSQC